jgi:hypothetical protein
MVLHGGFYSEFTEPDGENAGNRKSYFTSASKEWLTVYGFSRNLWLLNGSA